MVKNSLFEIIIRKANRTLKKFGIGLLLTLMVLLILIPPIGRDFNKFKPVVNNTNSPFHAAATSTVTVIKYDAHLNVLGNITVDYLWMEEYLPKVGDGATNLYCQGPTFDYTTYETVWDLTENVNVDSRYYGKPMGTNVKDLCNLVGGATKGCQIKIMASDNFAKWFDYETVYEPDPRQGPMVVAWYNGDPTIGGASGYVPDYATGMRLLFFADTSTNPQGRHVYGNWDEHDTLPESRVHYYYDGNFWPTTSGLSVQVVNRIFIYEPSLIACNATGGAKETFYPGETVYVKGMGMTVNKSYSLWIQPEPMSCNELVVDEGYDTYTIQYPLLYSGEDPSGARENITTNGSGDFGPQAIWDIAANATTPTKYDIVADCLTSGISGQYGSYDYIDNPGWEGFNVKTPPTNPPEAPMLDVINPNPDYDGAITLDWHDVETADTYTVYRDTSLITAINGSIITLGTVTASSYTDSGRPEGIYYYAVTAANIIGNSSLSNCENVTVIIPEFPLAAFSADVTNGTAPLSVHFTDQSTEYITHWAWDFNNDSITDSVLQNPIYTYDDPGYYTVALTVTNLAGTDSEVKVDYVNVMYPTMGLLWGPYLTKTTTTGTVVNVKTTQPTNVTVEYATEAEYAATGLYNFNATEETSIQLHHIPLSGLNPNTIYHYRISFAGNVTSADFQFRTYPTSGSFKFVVLGDTQDNIYFYNASERFKLVADSIAAQPDLAFVLIVGDLVNEVYKQADWNRFFEAGRLMLTNTTLYAALGNHEANNTIYYDIFGLPEYYSFDCGDAHFTVLDSNTWADISAQATWLDSDLDSTKPWKFVMFHHPVYTSDPSHFGGWANLQFAWKDIFETHNVSAVWNGHVHAYERYLDTNIQYMVIGTGGGPLDTLSTEKYDGYQNSLEHSLAYAKVTIDSAAEKTTIQIIRVADISLNNSKVTIVYPLGTVFETVMLSKGAEPGGEIGMNSIIVVSIVIGVSLIIGVINRIRRRIVP